MKPAFVSLSVLCLALGGLHGQSEIEKEFAKLKQQRDAAMNEAVASIKREFQRAGEELLAKAVAAGDADAAAKMRVELKVFTAPDLKKATVEEILKSGTWEWRPDSLEDAAFGTVTFLPDGKVAPSGPVSWIKSWKMMSEKTFRVYYGDSAYWLFEYFPEEKHAATIPDPGSIGDTKFLTPLSK